MDEQKKGRPATFEQATQLERNWVELLGDVASEDRLWDRGGIAAQRLIERFDVVHAITEGCFATNALMVYGHVRTRIDCNLSFADALKQSGAKIPENKDPYYLDIERWFSGDDYGVDDVTLEAVAFTAIPSYGGPKGKMPDVALAEFGLRPATGRHTLAFAAACNPASLAGCVIWAWGVVRHGEERRCLMLESREDDGGKSTWWIANRALGGICSSLCSRHLLLAVRDEKPVE